MENVQIGYDNESRCILRDKNGKKKFLVSYSRRDKGNWDFSTKLTIRSGTRHINYKLDFKNQVLTRSVDVFMLDPDGKIISKEYGNKYVAGKDKDEQVYPNMDDNEFITVFNKLCGVIYKEKEYALGFEDYIDETFYILELKDLKNESSVLPRLIVCKKRLDSDIVELYEAEFKTKSSLDVENFIAGERE